MQFHQQNWQAQSDFGRLAAVLQCPTPRLQQSWESLEVKGLLSRVSPQRLKTDNTLLNFLVTNDQRPFSATTVSSLELLAKRRTRTIKFDINT